jgi:hypothetical protein
MPSITSPLDFLHVDAVYALFGPQLDAPATYRELSSPAWKGWGQTPPGLRASIRVRNVSATRPTASS